ncbi:unnamed protein product [Rhizoctonia solani]|uniref:Uncharacterized protein n=1 Tax=Rhizoctonia solani TaxID=456999 RepID=A0A8H3BBY4_9AGAM|nr:unnamed protein product [Rhizoctonia solani]CAE6452057.1 unnamed protein product [Rhizoctonia solani]
MSPHCLTLSLGPVSHHSAATTMLFSPKSIVLALMAFVVAAGAVPTTLDERCHHTDRVCNPHTAATCPRCCYAEQCIGRPCEVNCDLYG